MNMPPEKFEQLLQLLTRKGATFCFVSELEQYRNQKNVVALSFDDGFMDNYLYAYPLLKNIMQRQPFIWRRKLKVLKS